jgi:ribonucleoside-triphosphate reductase
MATKFTQIQKRDGRIVDFDEKKIEKAIHKALVATEQGDGKIAKKLAQKVLEVLEQRIKGIPTVEQVQDIVEEVLILENYVEVAKAYILYREQRRKIRETKISMEDAVEIVDQYVGEMDWEVRENSNMSYSLQGLNNYVSSAIIKKYWLNKVYPKEVREAAENGDIHIHNLQTLGPYCCGWDLYDLLLKGFGGVFGKMESKPAKHFRSALGQIVNFFYTLQGEAAGAEAFSSFDTYLAPFIRYDNLNYSQVKQALQEFLFNCNVPTRVGFQTPFTNITLDLKVPDILKEQSVIIGGKPQDYTYGEFQEEMDIINKAFAEVMMEGDAKGRPFTFPIPTYNITKDFDWDNPTIEPVWEMTAKYGIPYFSNFINSDMKPEDVRSMCCRLRLDNRELYHKGGGLFGANPLTGSIGVIIFQQLD